MRIIAWRDNGGFQTRPVEARRSLNKAESKDTLFLEGCSVLGERSTVELGAGWTSRLARPACNRLAVVNTEYGPHTYDRSAKNLCFVLSWEGEHLLD